MFGHEPNKQSRTGAISGYNDNFILKKEERDQRDARKRKYEVYIKG